jgi:hypothetical protein
MRSVTKRDLITPSSDDAASASRNIHIEHIYQSDKKKKKQKIHKIHKKKGGRGVTSETYWAWSHLGRLTKKCREQVLRCCWPGTCRPPYRQSWSSGFSVRCRIRSTRSSRRHCYAEARRSSATPPDERPHKKRQKKKSKTINSCCQNMGRGLWVVSRWICNGVLLVLLFLGYRNPVTTTKTRTI